MALVVAASVGVLRRGIEAPTDNRLDGDREFAPNLAADDVDVAGGSLRLAPWWGVGAGPQAGLELFGEAAGGEPDVFEGHTAEEVMTRTLLTIEPEASVGEAAARMLEHNVHRLLVVERGQLEGVITTRDLIRVLAAFPATATAGDALPEKP